MQSAIWHSWEFGGWYRRVPYGTLGRERVNLPYLEIIDRVPLKINCSHLKTHFL